MSRLEARVWAAAYRVLTPRQVEVFELHFIHGLTQADIAAHLGVTRQAVNARLTLGAQKIRDQLKEAA